MVIYGVKLRIPKEKAEEKVSAISDVLHENTIGVSTFVEEVDGAYTFTAVCDQRPFNKYTITPDQTAQQIYSLLSDINGEDLSDDAQVFVGIMNIIEGSLINYKKG